MNIMWLGVGLTTDTIKTQMYKREWTTCSKFTKQLRLSNQDSWGDLYDHINEHVNLQFDNE